MRERKSLRSVAKVNSISKRERKSLRSEALRQFQLGPWLGGVKDLSSHTAIYISGLNMLMIAVTAYHTTLREYIQNIAPWFNFGMFLMALFIVVFVLIIMEYKFVLPSTWAFRNMQQYKHEYPIKRDIRKLSEKLDRLEEIILDKKKGK